MEIEKCASQKISFKVFSNEQKSKMQTKYPFLSKSQINKKIKDLWKKLDTAEKSCYTKTILSPPKRKKVNKPQTKRVQAGAFCQNKSYSPYGRRFDKDKREDKTSLSNLQQNQIRKKDARFHEKDGDGKDSSNRLTKNRKVIREGSPKVVGVNSCRKTVPWKGRPILGKSDLWSDSSSPDRVGGKEAKPAKKQKKVQSILKPSGDVSRPLKTKNRVSFGSPQNNVPSKTSSPGNFGNLNITASSDEDDNSARLLHGTDEEMYDFERIARHDLCVEEEDMYVTMFQQNSDFTPNQHLSKSDNQQQYENETDFKIPMNVISKRKRKDEEREEDKRDPGENLLSPLTEVSSQNSPSDITTPTVKVKHTLTNSLITPQMNESLMEQKLKEVTKAPQKAKSISPKASSRTEPVRKSTRRSISSGTSKKSDVEKETSDSESLSVTPLTESLPSENESTASQCSQGAMEETANVLCTKKKNLGNANSLRNPEKSTFERNSFAEYKCKATNLGKKMNTQQKRKRRGQHIEAEKPQDAYSTSSSSESSSSLKENLEIRHKMPQLCKKDQTNIKPPLSANNKPARQSSKEQREIEENSSPKPCKKSKKVKSPVGRMDADRLISESPNKIDSIKNSPIEESCYYFNDDLSNDSDNSSTVMDDRKQTNQVIMSTILRMQQAVQCQDTPDTEASSPSLSGIIEPSSLTSEDDDFEEVEEEEKYEEGENKLNKCEETTVLNTENIIIGSQIESGTLGSSNASQEVVNTQSQDQTPAQENRQSEILIGDKDTQQTEKAQHAEKKLCSTGINLEQVCAGDKEKDVFQMFSKPSSITETNMQTRRFISSAKQESRSNFTDLFHEDDIF